MAENRKLSRSSACSAAGWNREQVYIAISDLCRIRDALDIMRSLNDNNQSTWQVIQLLISEETRLANCLTQWMDGE